MKIFTLAMFGLVAMLASNGAFAQDRGQRGSQNQGQFDDNARQATNQWYDQVKNNPPAGLRPQDRLSPDQESRLRPGAVLDKDLRSKVHPAPSDLKQRLPPPARGDKYVTIGGHVSSINNNYQVHDVIHLHDGR
jgi:hypothetical protein